MVLQIGSLIGVLALVGVACSLVYLALKAVTMVQPGADRDEDYGPMA